jgi:hypothetical protein
MNGKFRLPSPAIVVACVALLAALSGTAFAQLGESAPIGSTTVRLAGGEINPTSEGMFQSGCLAGERAIRAAGNSTRRAPTSWSSRSTTARPRT